MLQWGRGRYRGERVIYRAIDQQQCCTVLYRLSFLRNTWGGQSDDVALLHALTVRTHTHTHATRNAKRCLITLIPENKSKDTATTKHAVAVAMGSQNATASDSSQPSTKKERKKQAAARNAVKTDLTALQLAPTEDTTESFFLPEQLLPPHIQYADDKDEFRDSVTWRFHSVAGYIFHWKGTVTQYSWPKLILYAIYVAIVCIIAIVNCPEEEQLADPYDAPFRCRIGYEYTDFIGESVLIWFAFSAFLFQSFVNAGLRRFDKTLTLVRRVQGRYHELGLLLHSHALPPARHTLVVIRRYMLAMVYLLFDDPVYGPVNGEFLPLVSKILEPEEYETIRNIKKPSDRAHAVMTWILSLCESAINADCSDGQEPLFQDTNGTLGFQIARCLETLRATVGSLTDSLDDAMLPFPFSHLIICNIYLEFAVLPWASMGHLGYCMILVATIYFWFLDGMITFVFLVDDPFVSKMGGRKIEPLIDIHKIIAEIASALPRRYPTAYATKPRTCLEIIRSVLLHLLWEKRRNLTRSMAGGFAIVIR